MEDPRERVDRSSEQRDTPYQVQRGSAVGDVVVQWQRRHDRSEDHDAQHDGQRRHDTDDVEPPVSACVGSLIGHSRPRYPAAEMVGGRVRDGEYSAVPSCGDDGREVCRIEGRGCSRDSPICDSA